jgi:hypothetical protein
MVGSLCIIFGDNLMSIIDKAQDTVISHTPSVLKALGKVKFFLFVIPITCVIIGVLSQKFLPARYIVTSSFKIGSFATPANPVPLPLASETQLRARLRANALELREEYPTTLLIKTIIENDVVSPTVTGVGSAKTIEFMKKMIEPEINLHNGRLEKLQAVQEKRSESLEGLLEEMQQLAESLSKSQQSITAPIELLAIQHGLDSTRERIGKIKLELSTLSLLNASDLYIDTTQIIIEPRMLYTSKWSRPLTFGAAGLVIGLIIISLIALTSIFRTIISKRMHHGTPETQPGKADKPLNNL